MIKTLSPYYITIPFVSPLTALTCTSFTLKIYVWSGLKSDVPASATWERTEKNPTASTSSIKINVARLLSDFIDFTQVVGTGTELINSNNQKWVKWETYYTTTNPLDSTTPTNQNTQIFLKGYSYGLDGENATTPVNKILIPIQDYKVSRNSTFIVPIEVEETTVTLATLTIDNISSAGGDQYTLSFSSTGNIEEVYYRYKLDGAVDWTVGFESSLISPFDITLPTDAGTYNVQIFSYDSDNAVNVYSNIFNVIVV